MSTQTTATASSKAMIPTDARSFDTTALTQSCDSSQRCANPFCKRAGIVEIKSPRGKHGRYCSDSCRLDGYVLRRARAMLDEVGIIQLNIILQDVNMSIISPLTFIDKLVKKNELGQSFTLMEHQREILRLAFDFDKDGRLPWDTILYSCVKKSGKTTLNGALTLYWGHIQEAPNEILILANDMEQALARVFKTMEGIIKHNPELQREAEVQTRTIYFANGTTATAISGDYAGAAGSNHGFSSWDELWAYSSESSMRLWEELTPVPTRKNSIRFISTYAGF